MRKFKVLEIACRAIPFNSMTTKWMVNWQDYPEMSHPLSSSELHDIIQEATQFFNRIS